MTDYLIDTNILLRAAQPNAQTHALTVEAIALLLNQGDNIFITPQILIEFWAVASRPVDANGLGWSSAVVEAEILQLLEQFPTLDDRPEIFSVWLTLVNQYRVQGKKVHDVRLVAVMQVYGIEQLLTFNGDDFRRYSMITPLHPNQIMGESPC